ncbi:hypothetical protein DSO57_1013077 [Entomophthora muscae]|uniref:Uncharacterized protein n=1 Tax=Entomophthora muscae TaxID=34485 RepID=A0ACC2SIT7_9FUNG|nr:hypothetical protein DSO57_1013077 [Entomophthora muscae]
MLGVGQQPSSNALSLIMPPQFDEKLVTSDEDRKQLRLVAIALAERFVNHLFGCEGAGGEGLPQLSEFIYRVIRRTNSSLTTLFVALIYLIRLKQKHPACKGTHSSPHRLLLASIIIAYKYLYDNCYHNRSWAQVSQGLFKLEEINKMEVELLFFLGFQLYVSKQHWTEFVEFMDGKLTRSLSQTPNQDHLRKVLWVELFPLDGLHRLHRIHMPKLTHSRRSTPSLRSSVSSTTTIPSLSRHSEVNLKKQDSSPSSCASSAATPTEAPPQRMLFSKVSSVFSKPTDTLTHAWLDLHSSILPGRRRRESAKPAQETPYPSPFSPTSHSAPTTAGPRNSPSLPFGI